MTLINLLRTAWVGVSSNKLRAVLTTLGIIIGVASVISTQALGTGARAAVASQFQSLGANDIQINTRMQLKNGSIEQADKPLTYEDGLQMPYNVPEVERVDMSVQASARLRNERNTLDVNIQGVTASALDQVVAAGVLQPADWPTGKPVTGEDFLAEGRSFTESEVLSGQDVCILGSETAQDLFEGDDPIGQTIQVGRKRCQVVGVLARLEPTDASQRYTQDFNTTFFMPISTVIQQFYDSEPSVNMTVVVKDAKKIDQAKQDIIDYLRRRHDIQPDAAGNYTDDFDLTTRSDILGAQQQAASTFALLLTAMAVVSLIVGGIGIMNVMLVSVTERTREIGVRLAVGARQRDIVSQFLVEAAIISAAGGVLGIVAGIFSIPGAAALSAGNALLAPESIPLAFGVAVLTGILFGLYPALRAARLDPIEALRYE
jgi:putative ABC transport system permease protein